MNLQKAISWLAGKDDLPEIYRIYNLSCLIAMLFCLLAAVESVFASLNPILIANNCLFSILLAVLFYLSRFKQKTGLSRFLSIFVLLFIYTPVLWIYNGGSASGIPYYILLFSSFLTILIVGKKDAKKNSKTISWVVLVLYAIVTTALILLELFRPELFYKFDNPVVRYFDTIISMLFALTGNYFILRAFIELYYKQLDKIKDYSGILEDLAVRDSMTGLYNHAYILSKLSDEIEKCRRYQRPLSILMIDIDHFKQINDRYGHSCGDEVLTKVAQCLQTNCRSVDVFARYGGEEFLAVLPETNATSAFMFGNRLLTAIQNLQFSHDVQVTISGGIAQYQNGDSPSTLVERADSFLYRAKEEGRNCIRVSPA